jgi:diguanylate cyclase (GGDEF)-like protein
VSPKKPSKGTPDTEHELSTLSTEPAISRQPLKEQGAYTPVLICIEGTQRGKRFPVRKQQICLGRSSSVEVPVHDSMASRRHARITYKNFDQPAHVPECSIEDLGSRNGTELNGRKLNSPCVLRERDRILIGSTVFGFFLRDEEELQMDHSLYEQATRDPVTGLGNKHEFLKHLTLQTERSQRSGSKLCLLIVDIDNLKEINDVYGHDVGDAALAHLAKVLSTCCRTREICARWGGDEFALLLPETSPRAARTVAGRIQLSVRTTPLRKTGGTSIPISVSIGGAVLSPDDNPDTFFRRADQQLLRAKELGRNQIVFSLGRVLDSSSLRRNQPKS